MALLLLLGLGVALLLVAGQSFWKASALAHGSIFDHLSFGGMAKLLLDPMFLVGCGLYVGATLLYLLLFAKFDYFRVQAIVVPLCLVLALGVSVWKFHERVSVLNLVGLAVMLVGIGLVLKR